MNTVHYSVTQYYVMLYNTSLLLPLNHAGTYDNSYLMTLKANDSDIGINAHMTYYISGSRYISVDSNSAEITISGSIDAYQTPEIKVKLTATSSSSYSQVSVSSISFYLYILYKYTCQ